MKVKFATLSLAALLTFGTAAAQAHEGKHDGDDEKSIPTTCAQLANKQKYITDSAYPEVKALKSKCDAEGKKPTQQHPSDHTHN